MMISFVIAVAVVLLLALAVVRKRRKEKNIIMEGVPRVNYSQVKGNFTAITKAVSDAAISSGEKFVIFDSPLRSLLLATHPDTVKAILTNNETIKKSQLRSGSMFASLSDGSLLFVNGEAWRHQRGVMAPAFQFSYMKGFLPLMIEKTELTLTQSSEDELFDVSKWMSLFTVDVLGLAGFGVDFKALQQGGDNDYYTAYTTMSAYTRSNMRSPLAMFTSLLERLPLPKVTKARKAKEILQAMMRDVAEQRRKVANEGGEKKFLLDMMLEAHPPLSDKEIQTNIFLFFLAGHETTSSALTWALHLLAEHQDVQTRLREEVDRVLNGNYINEENIKDLVYMDMVIKEVLRYGCPVSLITTRNTEEDIQVEQYHIPKGTGVGIGIYPVHHNLEFWPDPEKFDPERFDPKVPLKHPFAFIPFSLGKRVCIGNNFSIMEQKVFLSILVQKFTFEYPKERGPFMLDPSTLGHTPKDVKIILHKRSN